MRHRFAVNPMLRRTTLRKPITPTHVHLRDTTTIWRSHWRRRRYIKDSR